MKIKFLPVLMALLISVSAYSQDALFKVLASKGSNKVVAGNSTEHKTVLIGQKLLPTDKIVIGENSYLGLAHKNGKTIELKKAGTYEVSKLSGEVAAQNAGVAKKYVDFVAGEISSQDENMAKNRHKYMAVTGSVERGTDKFKVLSPKEAFCLADEITLKWYPYEHGTNHVTTGYIVTLMNLAEEPLFKTETTDNSVIVDLGKYNFKEEKNIIWKVSAKVKDKKTNKVTIDSSDNYILKYVNDNQAVQVEKEAADMRSELSEPTALNKFVLANFYEEKNLLLEALTNYEAASKLEPEVEDYKVAYGQFLERTKLVPEKK